MTISHKRRGRGGGLRILLLGILCLVVAAIFIVWRGPFTGLFWGVFSPIFGVVHSITSAGELERLRNDLEHAQSLVADRDVLLRENTDLKIRLGRLPEHNTTILGTVLMRPPATPYDTLVLDVGLQEGVSVGDLVFSSGAVIIGRITEVYRGTSRATLYSAPGESHDAIILTEGGSVPIAVEGQGGASLKGQLPQGVEVQIGDSVLFPSLMPMLVAKVAAMEIAPGESFVTVYMQLPANPSLLHYIEVRKPELQ